METSEVRVDYEEWHSFFLQDEGSVADTRYNKPERKYREDYLAFAADLADGHPEAVDMYTRFITWKLKR